MLLPPAHLRREALPRSLPRLHGRRLSHFAGRGEQWGDGSVEGLRGDVGTRSHPANLVLVHAVGPAPLPERQLRGGGSGRTIMIICHAYYPLTTP